MANPNSNPKVASFSVSPASGVVAPKGAPEVATPSTVVQTERKLEFMKEREAPQPSILKRVSAKVQAEHDAGAAALANYQ